MCRFRYDIGTGLVSVTICCCTETNGIEINDSFDDTYDDGVIQETQTIFESKQKTKRLILGTCSCQTTTTASRQDESLSQTGINPTDGLNSVYQRHFEPTGFPYF